MRRQAPSLDSAICELAEIALSVEPPSVTWPLIMASLEGMIGFDSGFIASTPGTAASAGGAIFGHDEAALRAQIGPYLTQVTPDEIRQYTNRARSDHEIWSARRRSEMSELYDPLNPARAKHMLVRVSWRKGVLLGFNLERRSRPFDESELRLIDAVAPVIQLVDALSERESAATQAFSWAAEWRLTRRETDVTELALCGLQNPEIAGVLGLSVFRVRNILSDVFPKAGASTRTELAFLAQRSVVAGASVRSTPDRDGVTNFFERVRAAVAVSGSVSGRTRVERPGHVYASPAPR